MADIRLMAAQGLLGDYTKESLRMAESNFLAALSWVWDAQERTAAADHSGWLAGLKVLPLHASQGNITDLDVRHIMGQTQFTEFDRNEFARRLTGKKRSRARAKAA